MKASKMLAILLVVGMGLLPMRNSAAYPDKNLAPDPAQDSQRGPHKPEDRPMLYLGVQWLGKPLKMARNVILQRLRHAGQWYKLPAPELTSREQDCRSISCLLPIAQKQKVTRILGGYAVEAENKVHLVNLWMLDLRLGETLLEEQTRCEACTDEKLEDAFRRAADALIERDARAAAPAAVSDGRPGKPEVVPRSDGLPPPPVPETQPAAPPSPSVETRPASPTLAMTQPNREAPQSIGQRSQGEHPGGARPPEIHQQPAPPMRPIPDFDSAQRSKAPSTDSAQRDQERSRAPSSDRSAQSPGAPDTGVLAVSASAQSPVSRRRSYGRGVAIGLFSGLLVAVLGTTVAFTALDQTGTRPLCQIPSGVGGAVDCAPRGLVYGLGYGLSAALAGGLILTLALPGSKEVR